MSGVANEFETVARYRKARKLADVLIAAGASAENMEKVDSPSVRENAIAITGVIEPSEVTWELVKHLIREGR